MIPPANAFYRQALARPHEAYSRVEVWRAGVQVAELAWAKRTDPRTARPVFFDGSVRATLASRVTRTMTLSVPDYLYPWDPWDLLNPYGQELRVFRGIRYGSGEPDEFPIFTGRIRTASGRGDVQIGATDNAGVVVAAGLAAPLPATRGALIVDEVERLILLANPAAVFGEHDDIDTLVPAALAYDQDLGSALDSLAKAADAFWYALADGRYVLRRVPWNVAPTGQPVQLADGPGGVLVDATPDRTSEGLFNRITVTSERPDGAAPIYATADDTDPASPTYIGGPMGVQATQIRVTGIESSAQALALARSLIRRTRAIVDSWQITCQADASLELGDPAAVFFRSRGATQVVSGLSMPLGAGTMTIDGRGYTTGAVEVSPV